VQDFSEPVAEGKEKVAGDEALKNVEFMEYNFLTEQKVKGADVYYFRAIFHNWLDESYLEILKNQVPGKLISTYSQRNRYLHRVVADSCLPDDSYEERSTYTD
jgi:hypothetical protein